MFSKPKHFSTVILTYMDTMFQVTFFKTKKTTFQRQFLKSETILTSFSFDPLYPNNLSKEETGNYLCKRI